MARHPIRGKTHNSTQSLTASIWPALTVFLVYSAAVGLVFANADDMSELGASLARQSYLWVQTTVEQGRPLLALYTAIVLPHLHALADLRWPRIFGLVGAALLAWLVHQALKRVGLGEVISWTISIAMLCLPTWQVVVAWAIMAPYFWAAVLAAASWFVLKVPQSGATRYVWATLLLAASAAIYQPAAMVFWIFVAVSILGDRKDQELHDMWRSFVVCIVIAAIALLIDFGLAHSLPDLIWPTLGPYARTALVRDVPLKVHWFLTIALPFALNLYWIGLSTPVAIVVALFAFSGLFAYWQGSGQLKFAKLIIAVTLIPLTYVPNLVVAEDWASHRTMLGLESLLFLYVALGFVACIERLSSMALRDWLPITAAFLIAVFSATNFAIEFAIPQIQEMGLLRLELASIHWQSVKGLAILPTNPSDSAAPVVSMDEFGLPDSSQPWAVTSMVAVAMHGKVPVPVAVVYAAKDAPKGYAVIDLQGLASMRMLSLGCDNPGGVSFQPGHLILPSNYVSFACDRAVVKSGR